MKKVFSLLLFIAVCALSSAQQFSLYDITSEKFAPKGVPSLVSSPDGEFYYQANEQHTKIVKYAYKTGEVVATIFDVTTARESTITSFDGFLLSPDEKRILIYTDSEPIYRRSFKAVLYNYDIRRNMLSKLTNNSAKQSEPKFSRDGRMLAYVADNNIWLVKFDFDTESQITKDGELNRIINGATDWVYEEEFTVTSLIDFSADNSLMAFVKFDESQVKEYSMQIFDRQLYPDYYKFKYPKAGLKNSFVRCMVFDIDAKTTREIPLPNHVEYIPKIEFFAQGDNLAVMTLNREQNHFELYSANGRSLVARSILQEKNERYVDSELLKQTIFFNDQFVYPSEENGYVHLYLYDVNGVKQRQLTTGQFDVTALLAVDPVKKMCYYQAAVKSPLQREIYKVDMVKGTVTQLSAKGGTNRATFGANGKYHINNYSNTTTPDYITLNDENGKVLRVLESNDELLRKLQSEHSLPKKDYMTVKAADGTPLNAYMLKPANFSSAKKYPLVMVQYSGPDSQQVLDRFNFDWTYYLVSQGYVVACVDGRGTGARGEDFRKCTYMNLGIYESDDQIAAAKAFASLSFIDEDKIGIWGWSYGGYNVLMSMSRGNGVFKSGVAIAPVTDWKFYDTVYTERFMRTPQQNDMGYENASAIKLANKLQGNLLIIHGSADDNVHFQNTMEYTNALINAGKQFDMFVMPDRDHSMTGALNRTYLYNKVINYFNRNM